MIGEGDVVLPEEYPVRDHGKPPMPGLTYGEMRVLRLGVMAIVSAADATIAGESLSVILSLHGIAGGVFYGRATTQAVTA